MMRWIAVYAPVRWPAGILTTPELDQDAGGTRPADFAADVAELERLLREVATDRRGRLVRAPPSHLRPHVGVGVAAMGVPPRGSPSPSVWRVARRHEPLYPPASPRRGAEPEGVCLREQMPEQVSKLNVRMSHVAALLGVTVTLAACAHVPLRTFDCEGVLGLRLGQSREEVKALLGEPLTESGYSHWWDETVPVVDYVMWFTDFDTEHWVPSSRDYFWVEFFRNRVVKATAYRADATFLELRRQEGPGSRIAELRTTDDQHQQPANSGDRLGWSGLRCDLSVSAGCPAREGSERFRASAESSRRAVSRSYLCGCCWRSLEANAWMRLQFVRQVLTLWSCGRSSSR